MKKKPRNILLFILVIVGLLLGGIFGYLSDSYSPTELTFSALESTEEVRVEIKEDYQAFLPEVKSAKNEGIKIIKD